MFELTLAVAGDEVLVDPEGIVTLLNDGHSQSSTTAFRIPGNCAFDGKRNAWALTGTTFRTRES